MDAISVAIMGVMQSTTELVHASQGLASNVEALVTAVHVRELLLIQAARQYPHLPPAAVIAACATINAGESEPTN